MLTGVVTVLTAIIGVAILAVILGSKNTASVLQAGGNAFSTVLGSALTPVTGGSALNLLGGTSLTATL
jgi:hypothetical protein